MATTVVPTPTSRLRFGAGRADITPPVGIYHRLWGAARHDRASGVHRPLYGDVMVFAPRDGDEMPMIRAQFDMAGLANDDHERLAGALAAAAGVPHERVIMTFSHTHSSGWFAPDRLTLPGGELIPAYLRELEARTVEACRQALSGLQPATITYATGRCDMAAHRDYYDSEFGAYVCGYNPDRPVDNTVTVGRITDEAGGLVGTLVHYACHGTTLAWENSLISPDYVGAMREEVERASAAPCIFVLGPCGDLGPRDGFVGDLDVADRNGRQLAYAALSTLAGMAAPETDFAYRGPVISGATLGAWRHAPFEPARQRAAERFEGGAFSVDLPLRPKQDPDALQMELQRWEEIQREADARGDGIAARDAGARAERARRWLGRLDDIPAGDTAPLSCSVFRMGDAVWVTTGGEPYSLLQNELRRRFPHLTILASPLAGNLQIAYLLPRDRYGLGLYQEEPSILAPGCLERLIETLTERIPG
jgi:hypothetical protein